MLWFRLLFGLGVFVAAAAPVGAASRIAFVGLDGLGLDRAVVHPFERLVQETVAELAGGTIVTPTEVTARLTQAGLTRLQSCAGNADCLADLGGVLETPFVLFGSLTHLSDHYVVGLRLVEIETGVVRRGKQQLTGERDLLIQKMRELVTQLLDPAKFTGSLLVVGNVATARATLDGELLALTGEAIDVTVGQHTLTVAAPGYQTLSTLVEVRFGELARVDAVLQPGGFTLLSGAAGWWPTAAMGAGGVGLAAGGTLGYLTERKETQVEESYVEGLRGVVYYRREAREGRALALWTNVAFVVGGALLSAGVLGWWLTDDPVETP